MIDNSALFTARITGDLLHDYCWQASEQELYKAYRDVVRPEYRDLFDKVTEEPWS